MENYKSGIDLSKYTSKENLMSASYNLGEYRQKYSHTSTAESRYNNFMRLIPTGSHIGKYEPLK